MGNNSMSATGGTGSGYHAKIVIDQAGYYTVSCGTGGISYGANKGGSAKTQPTNGGASALVRKSDNVKIVSAGGGTKGQAWINGGTAGSAGVLSKMSGLVEDTVYVSTNGKNGAYKHTENSNTVNGQNGPISGRTWGSTGMANGSAGGGRVGAAHHGFVYLKFIERLPEELYAYYVPEGIYDEDTGEYGFVVYSTEILTSASGATTGEKEVYCSLSPNNLVKECICKTYQEAISHPRTVHVTTLYSYGFEIDDDSFYIDRAIRCPNLDIHTDGTIGDGNPKLFCYKNSTEGYYGYIPLLTSDWYNIGYEPYYVSGGIGYTGTETYNNLEFASIVDEAVVHENDFGYSGNPYRPYERYADGDMSI